MTLLFLMWGNYNWTQVTGCYMVCAMTIQFGDCHEILNSGVAKGSVNWRTFGYGAFFGMLPWMVMWYEVYRFLSNYYEFATTFVPWWAWYFLGEYWLLFWCFPITLIL